MARRTKAQILEAQQAEKLEREALWFDSSMNLLEIIADHMAEREATDEEIKAFWDRTLAEVVEKRQIFLDEIDE